MKPNQILTTPLLAIVGAVLLHSSAQAQVPVSYSPDDLFLGLRSAGGTQDYLIDIGQASNFTGATGSFTLSIGNILPDIVSVFGANWNTRSDLFWSISGTSGSFAAVGNDPAKTLYATRAELTPGVMSDLWNRGGATTQGVPTTKMNGLAQEFLATAGVSNMSTANSNFAVIQNVTDSNSFASYMPGGTTANSGPSPGISFAYFNPTIEDSFANGTAGTQLDLVRLTPGTGVGDFVGDFTIDNNADVTFNKLVPEPGSFAILGAGAGLLGMLRRRRNA